MASGSIWSESSRVGSSSSSVKMEADVDMDDVNLDYSGICDESQCEEVDIEGEEDDKDFKDFKTLVQDLPKGMEIDWCPDGSIRQKRINKLVEDIEYLDKYGDEDSDSDVSLDLEDLDNPRIVQKVMKRPEYSYRRKKLESSKILQEDKKLWSETFVLLRKNEGNIEIDKLLHKEVPDATMVKVEEENLAKREIWTKIKEDSAFNVQFNLVGGKPFNKMSQKF